MTDSPGKRAATSEQQLDAASLGRDTQSGVATGQRQGTADGQFAALRARDASLFGALSALAPPEREALLSYLRTKIPLQEFDEAA